MAYPVTRAAGFECRLPLFGSPAVSPRRVSRTSGSQRSDSACHRWSCRLEPMAPLALGVAAIAAARELVADNAKFTGAQFSRKVLEKLGFGREFAVSDQGTRTRLHCKDVKLSAFEAAGVGGSWLKEHEVKPGPAVPVTLPELPAPAGDYAPRPLSAAELSALHGRCASADVAELTRRGALLIPGLLTAQPSYIICHMSHFIPFTFIRKVPTNSTVVNNVK